MPASSKAYGAQGGFSLPIVAPPGDYTAQDGDVIIADGPKTIFIPPLATSEIGVIIRCISGELTLASNVGDTLEITSITKDESIQLSPTPNSYYSVVQKNGVDSLIRGFTYSDNGDDSRSGLSVETPRLTIQSALDSCALLIPVPSRSNPATVFPSQAGSYTESIALVDGVVFSSVGISLQTDSLVSIEGANFSGSTNTAVINIQDSSATYNVDGLDLFAIDARLVVNSGERGNCYRVSGVCKDIFIKSESTQVSGLNGVGLNFTGQALAKLPITGAEIDLIGDGSVAINWHPSAVSEIGICSVAAISNKAVSQTTGLLTTGSSTTAFSLENNSRYSAYMGSITSSQLCTIGAGSELSVICSNITADITVAAGSTLNIYCDNHAGVVTNSGRINGVINGVAYGNSVQEPFRTEVLAARDYTNQLPVAVDTPLQITFGVAVGTVSDPMMVDANGLITINETGQYDIYFRLQYGRDGAGGVSLLYYRIVFNAGGPDIYSTVIETKIDNANSDTFFESNQPVNVVAGMTIYVEFYRDSEGNDSGGLYSETPTLAGWTDTVSASIIAYRSSLIN